MEIFYFISDILKCYNWLIQIPDKTYSFLLKIHARNYVIIKLLILVVLSIH